MGAGQQPGLECLDPVGERALEVQRTHHAILGGTERQIHHGNRHQAGFYGGGVGHCRAVGSAAAAVGVWIAAIAASGDRPHLRQESRERADRSGLARPAIPEDQHAADRWVDGGDQQRQLDLVLTDDGRERKDVAPAHDATRLAGR